MNIKLNFFEVFSLSTAKLPYVHEITNDGHIKHDECIDYCLSYAFGKCKKTHSIRYCQYSNLYSFFDELESILPTEVQQLLNDKKKLLYYLAHQTRKIFFNMQVQVN